MTGKLQMTDAGGLAIALQAFGGTEALDNTFMGDATECNLSYCKELFKDGADVNVTDKNGSTVLHLISHERQEKHLAMARWLLENGADLKARDNFGATPLIECAKSGEAIEMACLFIAKGANLLSRDDCGQTALGWAQIVDRDCNRTTSDLTQLLEDKMPNRNLRRIV